MQKCFVRLIFNIGSKGFDATSHVTTIKGATNGLFTALNPYINDNGEIGRVIPWDFGVIDEDRLTKDPSEAARVLLEEPQVNLYQPTTDY